MLDTHPSRPARASGLHPHLREATRAAHLRTEDAFAPFLRAPVAELGPFLAAQLGAARALHAARDGTPVAEENSLLCDLGDAYENDLREIGHAPLPGNAILAPRPLDTLAVGYLTLGARLGTAVLARALTAAGGTLPRSFTLSAPEGAWRAFRQRLDTHSHDPARSARIVADVVAGFDLHRAAAARAWPHHEDRSP
ncbi:heme oxygenase-like domain-containing protein [Roseivivax sediminis]|uniref:Heme oxygenase n=1 Tax=Roseivivax sediminis TaxID=936889 RepID=A0A1I1W3W5_9RHOB|nr:biliverdin-producing heme oxygenase [Roseivivax sediminis]SFD88003.1 hypothetical protein SAMN04515678_10417 [Roseivivax sediminis]